MKMKIFFSVALFLIVLFIYIYIQISKFHIKKPTFHSNKLNENLRITQITDFHGNNLIDKNRLLKKIKEFNPHIVVLTGDIIDYKTEDIDGVLSFVKRIQGIANNTFFVIGNHELRNKKGDEFMSGLENIWVNILDNEGRTIKINEENINIIGLSFLLLRKIINLQLRELIKIDLHYYYPIHQIELFPIYRELKI